MPTQLCRSPESDVFPARCGHDLSEHQLISFSTTARGSRRRSDAAIARLCEITRGPVEVSRSDLARWCDAEREDAIGGAIERAIGTSLSAAG